MTIRLHPHAIDRLAERGATEEEVHATIQAGEQFLPNMVEQDFGGTFLMGKSREVGITRPNKWKPMQFKRMDGWF